VKSAEHGSAGFCLLSVSKMGDFGNTSPEKYLKHCEKYVLSRISIENGN
jgi:hypothetical protein